VGKEKWQEKEKERKGKERKEKEEACSGACRSLAKSAGVLIVPASAYNQQAHTMRLLRGQANVKCRRGEQTRGTRGGLPGEQTRRIQRLIDDKDKEYSVIRT
jgi:hypothetical protein